MSSQSFRLFGPCSNDPRTSIYSGSPHLGDFSLPKIYHVQSRAPTREEINRSLPSTDQLAREVLSGCSMGSYCCYYNLFGSRFSMAIVCPNFQNSLEEGIAIHHIYRNGKSDRFLTTCLREVASPSDAVAEILSGFLELFHPRK